MGSSEVDTSGDGTTTPSGGQAKGQGGSGSGSKAGGSAGGVVQKGSGVPQLSRELAHSYARDGIIIVTWANLHFLDFTLNWVHHMQVGVLE